LTLQSIGNSRNTVGGIRFRIYRNAGAQMTVELQAIRIFHCRGATKKSRNEKRLIGKLTHRTDGRGDTRRVEGLSAQSR